MQIFYSKILFSKYYLFLKNIFAVRMQQYVKKVKK